MNNRNVFYLQGSVLEQPVLKQGKNNSFTSLKLKVGSDHALYFFPYAFGKLAQKTTELRKGDEISAALSVQVRQNEILLVLTNLALLKRVVAPANKTTNRTNAAPQTKQVTNNAAKPQRQTAPQVTSTSNTPANVQPADYQLPDESEMPKAQDPQPIMPAMNNVAPKQNGVPVSVPTQPQSEQEQATWAQKHQQHEQAIGAQIFGKFLGTSSK